jgi:hypothetical protein
MRTRALARCSCMPTRSIMAASVCLGAESMAEGVGKAAKMLRRT